MALTGRPAPITVLDSIRELQSETHAVSTATVH